LEFVGSDLDAAAVAVSSSCCGNELEKLKFEYSLTNTAASRALTSGHPPRLHFCDLLHTILVSGAWLS